MIPAMIDHVTVPHKRSLYRRYGLWTLILVLVAVIGWYSWRTLQESNDARLLAAYMVELHQRDPHWEDRLYGKPLTSEQMEDNRRWGELQTIMNARGMGWQFYRQGLMQGMVQDPLQPTADFPKEQMDFLKAAHQFHQPLLAKMKSYSTMPGHHFYMSKDVPLEDLQRNRYPYSSVAYTVNESLETEVMYHIARNDPESAVFWLVHCQPGSLLNLYSTPSLLERWLNLTHPRSATLINVQTFLEAKLGMDHVSDFNHMADELRLQEKRVSELCLGSLSSTQIMRSGFYDALIPRDSIWRQPSLVRVLPYYLNFKVQGIYARQSNIKLRLHQMADRMEGLGKLPVEARWPAWKAFAEENSLIQDTRKKNWYASPLKPPGTEAMPDGLFYIFGKYAHTRMTFLFDRQVQLRTTLAAILAERFRLDQGRFPTSWSELVPRYCTEPLIDPYSGKPLLLKTSDKGIVIYSTGRDGQNNGGENLNSNHYWNYVGKSYDNQRTNIGTRVYLPALRRSAPISLEDDHVQALQNALKMNLPGNE